MAKSLSQIRSEIDRLQRSFDAVIATMKKDIAFHGLKVEDLFGGVSSAAVAPKVEPVGRKRKSAGAPKEMPSRAAKFGDAAGNTWGGMGKRPAWLNAELARGKTIESFLLNSAKLPLAAASPARPAAKPAAKKVVRNETAAAVKLQVAAKKPLAKKAAPESKPAKPSKRANANAKATAPKVAPATEAVSAD